MTRVFRLVRRSFCPEPHDAFSARGSLIAGGRWHRKGAPITYASWSRSLAVLEVLANVDRQYIASDYVFASATIADDSDIAVLATAQLPGDWRAPSRSASTLDIGDTFLRARDTLALAVPSALVPMERNFLINIRHERFPTLHIENTMEPFFFDARLFA